MVEEFTIVYISHFESGCAFGRADPESVFTLSDEGEADEKLVVSLGFDPLSSSERVKLEYNEVPSTSDRK